MIAVNGSNETTVALLAQFEPISLAEMGGVSLQDRIDTKYVIGVSELYNALPQVMNDYRVLSINGTRLNHYQTLYFDTPDFALFQQHHNGWGSRYKIRARRYVGSNLSFFEVKHKTNQGRTIKSRIQIPDVVAEADEFVAGHTPFHPHELEPKFWNNYLRITLVSKNRPERLTLDLNLEFEWGEGYNALPGVVIAEVKQAHFSHDSDFIQQMRHLNIRPASISKYCIGVCTLYQGLKNNNFKTQLNQINKVMQRECAHVTIH